MTFLSFAEYKTSLWPTHVLSCDSWISVRGAKIGQSLRLNVRFCLILMPTVRELWFLVWFHFTGFSVFSRHIPHLPLQDWISRNRVVNRPSELPPSPCWRYTQDRCSCTPSHPIYPHTVARTSHSQQTLNTNSTTKGQTLPYGPGSESCSYVKCFDIQDLYLSRA
jgi:hypothetical protein